MGFNYSGGILSSLTSSRRLNVLQNFTGVTSDAGSLVVIKRAAIGIVKIMNKIIQVVCWRKLVHGMVV